MTTADPAAVRPGLAILIPAAGGSMRMRGRDKLLEPIRGRPLLGDRVAAASAALASSRVRADGARVVVALPPPAVAPDRWAAVAETGIVPVEVTHFRTGLSASLKAGIDALPRTCRGLMILPADMPDITAADMVALIAAFDGETILRGTSADGRPGHPVLFPARDFAALRRVSGDRGGRDLLRAARPRVRLLPLPGEHALTDLDTPEDWADWRARQT